MWHSSTVTALSTHILTLQMQPRKRDVNTNKQQKQKVRSTFQLLEKTNIYWSFIWSEHWDCLNISACYISNTSYFRLFLHTFVAAINILSFCERGCFQQKSVLILSFLIPPTGNGNTLGITRLLHALNTCPRVSSSRGTEILWVNSIFNNSFITEGLKRMLVTTWRVSVCSQCVCAAVWACSCGIACMLIMPQFCICAVSDPAGLSEHWLPAASFLGA